MSDNLKDRKKDAENKNFNSLSVFNKFSDVFSNSHHGYLARKVERLTSALYVITGFIAHDDPVRNRLRTAALDLIAQASRPQSFTTEGTQAFRAKAAELGALLQTAQAAGLISRMNAELLQNEYANLAGFVKEYSESIRVSEKAVTADSVSIGQEDNKEILKLSNKTNGSLKGQKSSSPKKGQDNRRKVILDLLNKKDRISIKDASSAVGNCSEKTIQRELLALVRDGLAIKEGERRWSTYRKAVLAV